MCTWLVFWMERCPEATISGRSYLKGSAWKGVQFIRPAQHTTGVLFIFHPSMSKDALQADLYVNTGILFVSSFQVNDRPPNIFECQLRLWTQWFDSWSEEERNAFLNSLEEKDPTFVAYFYSRVAGTAGRD